ncbi:MAG: IPT/TIG domain-containing protein, partial [Acidobacteriota bacterium]
PTTFISANQLIALISADDLTFGGEVTINVFNPPPGAGTSNVVTLTILNPLPVLSSATPQKIGQLTSANTAVTIFGSNFVSGIVVRVNGVNRPTTRISSSQLTVQITPADKLNLGTLTLTAFNPGPGGGLSNSLEIEVVPINFLPRLTSISPDAANAGSAGLTLVLTGTNFAPNAVVRWGDRDLQTEFVSTATLLATVTASDLLLGGFVPVRVFNPEPGGGLSSALNFAINSPVPSISNVSPNPIVGTAQSSVITVDGTNFVGSSVVRFNGSPRPTVFLSTTQLAATLPATDLVGITSASISVFSPEPGGGLSNSLTVGVIPGVPGTPTITSLNPGAVIVGTGAFNLTVNGTNLFPNSVVQFNGGPRATSFISATQLVASISADDVANIGTASVTVFTPAPGGGFSNSFNFGIIASPPGAPTISSLNPSSAGVGTPFALTVNGANFATTSLVLVNGSTRATTFISGSQLVAQLTAADVASPANLSISVFTPAPGGGTSNSLVLSINATVNPVPTVLSLNPVSATAGGPAFVLTVNGANFVAGAVVRWNGINQPTVFVSSTQLTAQIPASNIASPGTIDVTVFNPPAGGGLSNSVAFGISPAGPPPSCGTICLRSARYYERNTNRLPNGLVLIGGFNANSAIQIQTNLPKIKDTLQGGESPLAELNKQFVAIQLSLILSGSSSVGGLQSSPSCYGISFAPVLLSNGVTLTPSSTTNDILGQVRSAIFELRAADMPALASILGLMNGDDPSNTCNRVLGSGASTPAEPSELDALPARARPIR